MKIMDLKKMTKGRYKLNLSDGRDLVLYEEVIIHHLLLNNKEIDPKLEEVIIKENNNYQAYHLALQYIGIRMRCREEIRVYLKKKEVDNNLIDETVIQLEKEGYLNDEKFAIAFVNDKISLTNEGINKIERDLDNFKIDDAFIANALASVSDEILYDRINRLITKQLKTNNKYSGNMLKMKILNYLIILGYDSTMVMESLDNVDLKNISNIKKEYDKLVKKYAMKYSGYKLEMTIKQKLYQKGYDISEIENVMK